MGFDLEHIEGLYINIRVMMSVMLPAFAPVLAFAFAFVIFERLAPHVRRLPSVFKSSAPSGGSSSSSAPKGARTSKSAKDAS